MAVRAIPGGAGGNALGLGIVFWAQDQFTSTARKVEQQMASLKRTSSQYASQIEEAQRRITRGLSVLAVGAAAMVGLSFPINEAMKFEQATTRVWTIAEKAGYSLKELQRIALNLSMDFLQSPTEEAEALYSTIAAGIEDVGRATALLRAANMAAVGTDSDLDKAITGLAAFVNAFNLGNYEGVDLLTEAERRTLSPADQARLNRERQLRMSEADFMRLNDMIFEAMNVGLFSHSPGVSDFEAMASQFGKLAPIASAVGLSPAEMLALWATSTRGGQDALRSATGIRQMFMDFLKPTSRMQDFAAWAQEQGINIHPNAQGLPNFTRMIRDMGIVGVLGTIRDYVTEDFEGLRNALNSDYVRSRLEALNQLPEDIPLEGSQEAMELLRELQNLGVINVDRAVNVFKSVWGLTAAIPLLTTQYESLVDILDQVENTTGGMQQAFDKMMATTTNQLDLLKSRWAALVALLGMGALPAVNALLQGLNTIVLWLAQLTQAFPGLTSVVMSSVGAMAILATTIGLVITASGALKWADVRFRMFFENIRWGARWAAGGIRVAFFDLFWIIGLITAAVYTFRWAWENNFRGIRDTLTNWWNRVQLIGTAILEWVRTLTEEGIGSISEELAQQLEAAGVYDTFVRLAMLIWRLKNFIDGFREGFVTFLTTLRDIGLWVVDKVLIPVVDWLAEVAWRFSFLRPVIETIKNLLQGLIQPTQENVDAWRAVGVAVGIAVAWLLVFVTVIRPIIVVAGFLGRALSVVAGILPVIGRLLLFVGRAFMVALGPVGWIILGISTLITFAVMAWQNNFLGFRDFVINTWNEIVRIARNVWTEVVDFARGLWDGLTGFIDESWRVLQNAWTTVAESVKGLWDGVKSWVLGRVESMVNGIVNLLNRIPGVNIGPVDLGGEAPSGYVPRVTHLLASGTSEEDEAFIRGLEDMIEQYPDLPLYAHMNTLLDQVTSNDSEGKALITKAEVEQLMEVLRRMQETLDEERITLISLDGHVIGTAYNGNVKQRGRVSPAGAY